MRDGWYYAEEEKPVGPLSFGALVTLLRKISNAGEVNIWHTGLREWHAAKDVPQIADVLYLRPPPIPQQILTSPVKTQPADGGDANSEQNRTRGRIALLIVLAIVLFVGAIFSTIIYDNSASGVGYLVGQLIGAAVILSLLAWRWRRSRYIAAVVLFVAAFSVGLINTQKLRDGLAARESKAALKNVSDLPIGKALEENPLNGLASREREAALKDVRDPTSIDKVLEQNPSNVFLQLMAAASNASLETDRLTQKLSDETKASVLDKDINFATASRAELEAIHRDVKMAEANATTAMPGYIALLKDEREKVERFARSLPFDNQTMRNFLDGLDNRHGGIHGLCVENDVSACGALS